MSDPKPNEVLQFVLTHRKPFVKTSDVAERFDSVSKKTVWKRLDKLERDGELLKEEVGANAVVWYPPVQLVEDAKTCRPS